MLVRKRRSGLWFGGALGAALLLLGGCSSGHDSLSSDVQAFGFERDFDFLVERRFGPEQCAVADCPSIARYYLSSQDAGRSCDDLRNLLRKTDVSPDRTLGDERCRFLGWIGRIRVDVRATDPMSEIPPDDQTLNPFPVPDIGGSVVVVRASRS